jgi:glycosyltransferase involved in cell wall biosynthesis
MNNVSVIIPSIGRESLEAAVRSAKSQTNVHIEVIVVDDSPGQKISFQGVQVLKTGGDRGVSFARNMGVAVASGNWISFLDDDDAFLPEKLFKQINTMIEQNWDLSYTSSFFVGHKKMRPKKTITPGTNPLTQIYSGNNLFGSQYYLPLPSLVISAEVSRFIVFNEALSEREDLDFAHQAYKKGFVIGQLSEPLVLIRKEPNRSLVRPSVNQDLSWASYLSAIERNLAVRFLFFIALRNRLWCRDFSGAIQITKNLMKFFILKNKKFL